MVSVEVPNEWRLVVWEGLRGREGGGRLGGCLCGSLGGVGCWERGLKRQECGSWGLAGGVGGGAQ